jgi:hypothetical protein
MRENRAPLAQLAEQVTLKTTRLEGKSVLLPNSLLGVFNGHGTKYFHIIFHNLSFFTPNEHSKVAA